MRTSTRLARTALALATTVGLAAAALGTVVPAHANDSTIVDNVVYEIDPYEPLPKDGCKGLPPGAEAVGTAYAKERVWNSNISGDFVMPDYVEINGKNYCVVEIGIYPFANLPNLTGFTFSQNIRVIGIHSFSDSFSGGTLTIPGYVEEIRQAAFWNAGITGLRFAPRETEVRLVLDSEAFRNTKLTGQVAIPEASWINPWAFGDITTWPQFVFSGERTEVVPAASDGFVDTVGTFYYPAGNTTYEDFKAKASPTFRVYPYTDGVFAIDGGTAVEGASGHELTGVVDAAAKTVTFHVLPSAETLKVSLEFLASSTTWDPDLERRLDAGGVTTWPVQATPYPSGEEDNTWQVIATTDAPAERVVKGVTYQFENITDDTVVPERCGPTESLRGIATAKDSATWAIAGQGDTFEIVQNPLPGYCTTTLAGTFQEGVDPTVVKNVKLAPTVGELPDSAFANWPVLSSVAFGENPALTAIGSEAFTGTGITSIDLAPLSKLTAIGDDAFAKTTAAQSLTLPDSLETIGDRSFEESAIAGTAAIPATVTSIGVNAFASTQIEAVTLTEGLQTIADGAFMSSRLKGTVVVPESVRQIGQTVFDANPDLLAIDLRSTAAATAPAHAFDGGAFVYYPAGGTWKDSEAITTAGTRAKALTSGEAVIGTMKARAGDETYDGAIDAVAKTVTFTVPIGTESLMPTMGFGGSAIDPGQFAAIDIDPVTTTAEVPYQIVPLDGTSPAVEWKVVVKRPAPAVERPFAGSSRLETSCLAAGDLTPGQPLLIANAWSYSDAAAGAAALHATAGTLVLSKDTTLNPCVEEKMRANPPSEVTIVGGVGVISADVESRLQTILDDIGAGTTVERIAGDNRYETAAEMAANARAWDGKRIIVASGQSDFDQATASSLAYGIQAPVFYLPSGATTVPQWLVALYQAEGGEEVYLVGGHVANQALQDDINARLNPETLTVASGASRYETSSEAAKLWPEAVAEVGLADGGGPIDAIAAASTLGPAGVPVLQTPSTCLDTFAAGFIDTNPVIKLHLLGGDGAVSDAVGQMHKCGA